MELQRRKREEKGKVAARYLMEIYLLNIFAYQDLFAGWIKY